MRSRRCTCLAIIVMTTVVMFGFGGAAAADDWETCAKAWGDTAIAACTRAIGSPRFKDRDLVRLYYNRGIEYDEKRDYDRAIADYNEVIHLDPIYAKAYCDRGNAWRNKGDLDRAIADYNEAIRLDPKDAKAYYSRGIASRAKGDLDSAIADYNEAIRLDPKDAAYYNNRGNAWRNKGDLDRAIADYNEAIRLDPKDAGCYKNRGVANLYAGSLSRALADLNQASELKPKDAYTALWLDVVNKRSNLPSHLPQVIAQLDMTRWPAPVIRLFLGQMTPDAVLAAADDPNGMIKQRRVCEASFFSGELRLMQGTKENAAHLFRLAATDCPKTLIVWSAANAELKALSSSP